MMNWIDYIAFFKLVFICIIQIGCLNAQNLDNKELEYHGGLKISGEAIGDVVNAKAQIKKLAKEILLDKSVIKKVKDWINLLDKVSKGPQEAVSGAKEYNENNK